MNNLLNAIMKNPLAYALPGANDAQSIGIRVAIILSVAIIFAAVPAFLGKKLGYEEFYDEEDDLEYDEELGEYVGNPEAKKKTGGNAVGQFFLGALVGYVLVFGYGAATAGFPKSATTGYSKFTYDDSTGTTKSYGRFNYDDSTGTTKGYSRFTYDDYDSKNPTYVPSYYRPATYKPRSFDHW